MKFKALFNIFDEDYELSEILDKMADQKNESRKFLDNHVRGLGKNGNKVEEEINNLINDYASVYFVAGFVTGRAFDATDRKALKEIKFIEKKIADVLGCWPRKKETPGQPGRGTGASSE